MEAQLQEAGTPVPSVPIPVVPCLWMGVAAPFQHLGKGMGKQGLSVKTSFDISPGNKAKANFFRSWASFEIIVVTEK